MFKDIILHIVFLEVCLEVYKEFGLKKGSVSYEKELNYCESFIRKVAKGEIISKGLKQKSAKMLVDLLDLVY